MGEGEVMDPLSRALLSTEAGAAQLPRMFLSTPNEHAHPMLPRYCHTMQVTLSSTPLSRDVSIAFDGVQKGAAWS